MAPNPRARRRLPRAQNCGASQQDNAEDERTNTEQAARDKPLHLGSSNCTSELQWHWPKTLGRLNRRLVTPGTRKAADGAALTDGQGVTGTASWKRH